MADCFWMEEMLKPYLDRSAHPTDNLM